MSERIRVLWAEWRGMAIEEKLYAVSILPALLPVVVFGILTGWGIDD